MSFHIMIRAWHHLNGLVRVTDGTTEVESHIVHILNGSTWVTYHLVTLVILFISLS